MKPGSDDNANVKVRFSEGTKVKILSGFYSGQIGVVTGFIIEPDHDEIRRRNLEEPIQTTYKEILDDKGKKKLVKIEEPLVTDNPTLTFYYVGVKSDSGVRTFKIREDFLKKWSLF